MKHFSGFFVLAIAFSNLALAAECPNFAGRFSYLAPDPRASYELVITQNGCQDLTAEIFPYFGPYPNYPGPVTRDQIVVDGVGRVIKETKKLRVTRTVSFEGEILNVRLDEETLKPYYSKRIVNIYHSIDCSNNLIARTVFSLVTGEVIGEETRTFVRK